MKTFFLSDENKVITEKILLEGSNDLNTVIRNSSKEFVSLDNSINEYLLESIADDFVGILKEDINNSTSEKWFAKLKEWFKTFINTVKQFLQTVIVQLEKYTENSKAWFLASSKDMKLAEASHFKYMVKRKYFQNRIPSITDLGKILNFSITVPGAPLQTRIDTANRDLEKFKSTTVGVPQDGISVDYRNIISNFEKGPDVVQALRDKTKATEAICNKMLTEVGTKERQVKADPSSSTLLKEQIKVSKDSVVALNTLVRNVVSTSKNIIAESNRCGFNLLKQYRTANKKNAKTLRGE